MDARSLAEVRVIASRRATERFHESGDAALDGLGGSADHGTGDFGSASEAVAETAAKVGDTLRPSTFV